MIISLSWGKLLACRVPHLGGTARWLPEPAADPTLEAAKAALEAQTSLEALITAEVVIDLGQQQLPVDARGLVAVDPLRLRIPKPDDLARIGDAALFQVSDDRQAA